MTYNKALEIIGACLGGSTNRKDFKRAADIEHYGLLSKYARPYLAY